MLVCDVSFSVTSDGMALYRSFLQEMLIQLPISHDTIRVAMVRFIRPPEVTWNLQSNYSYNYTTVMQGIETHLSDVVGHETVNEALRVVIDDVINSDDNRADAPNVIIVMGDGGGTVQTMPALDDLNNMARVLAVNVHASRNWARAPASTIYDSFRYDTLNETQLCTVQQVVAVIQSLYTCTSLQ